MLRQMIRASLVVVCLFGCVPAVPESDFDSSLASEVLDTALTAWKDGKAKSLSKRNPPIRFVDEDWRASYRLTQFEILHPDEPIQPRKGTQIQLTLTDRSGKTITRPAEYQITLAPPNTRSPSPPTSPSCAAIHETSMTLLISWLSLRARNPGMAGSSDTSP